MSFRTLAVVAIMATTSTALISTPASAETFTLTCMQDGKIVLLDVEADSLDAAIGMTKNHPAYEDFTDCKLIPAES